MAEHRYKVLRHIQGDKPYAPGDERVATPSDVGHLVPHVLEDMGPVTEKAEPAVENKADPPVANKAAAKAAKPKAGRR